MKEAIRLVLQEKRSQYRACKITGVSQSGLSNALKKLRETEHAEKDKSTDAAL